VTRFADSAGYRADPLLSLDDARQEYSPLFPKPVFVLLPSDSPSRLSLSSQAIQKRCLALSSKPLHTMIEPRLDFTIWPWRDVAHLNCAPKLIERLLHDFSGLLWIARFAFVINRQLFVCLKAVPRISECVLPEFTSQFEITLTLREKLRTRHEIRRVAVGACVHRLHSQYLYRSRFHSGATDDSRPLGRE
jgi:hypothetical protein